MWKIICLILGLVRFAWADQADVLLYQVKEPDLPPYLSRILVTDAFVRIDEGEGSPNGYTLYNRVSHTFFNVDPQEETVLVLQPPSQPAQIQGLSLQSKVEVEKEAPPVAGQQPVHIELWVNGQRCRLLQVLPHVMPKAVQGLRELHLALARLQGRGGLAELSPCEQANFVAVPELPYDHGLPLVDWQPNKQQRLTNFRARQEVSDRLFEVPLFYERVTPPPLGDGQMGSL